MEDNSFDKFFWIDNVSEEEIKDIISMFKNEYKPPLTLWIEKNHYNTENEEEEIMTTHCGMGS